jgi:adenine phosphoribosyltransferase
MPDVTGLQLTDYIRSVPDFPKPGILFRDVTPLLASPAVFRGAVRQMADHFHGRGVNVVAAAEARGFLFAGPLALELDAALVPIRKPGKLPFKTMSHSYSLEYGTDTLEMHVDAIQPGATVLVVDDLLATGGTAEACCHMIEKAGGRVVGCVFVIELLDCAGAEKLSKYETFSLVKYE